MGGDQGHAVASDGRQQRTIQQFSFGPSVAHLFRLEGVAQAEARDASSCGLPGAVGSSGCPRQTAFSRRHNRGKSRQDRARQPASARGSTAHKALTSPIGRDPRASRHGRWNRRSAYCPVRRGASTTPQRCIVLTNRHMLCSRMLRVPMRLREIAAAAFRVHSLGDVHRIVRTRKVQHQVPWSACRRSAEKSETVFRDPVVAVRILRQGRRRCIRIRLGRPSADRNRPHAPARVAGNAASPYRGLSAALCRSARHRTCLHYGRP